MKRDTTYDLDLVTMKEGLNEFDFHIGKDFFEGRESDQILDADIDVMLDVTKRRESYDCLFHFEGTLQVACDRCLEAVPVEVNEDYHVVVKHGEEYDDSADDLLVIPERDTRLDVAPLIYDTLLLAIPLRCVHPEGECNEAMSEILRKHNNEES